MKFSLTQTENKHNLSITKAQILPQDELNKAFVGLGSCDNVQTKRKIFEYANWPRLKIKRTGPSSCSVQLVRSAGPSSWSVQLIRSACLSSWSVKLVWLADLFSWSVKLIHLAELSCLLCANCTMHIIMSKVHQLQSFHFAKFTGCKVHVLQSLHVG